MSRIIAVLRTQPAKIAPKKAFLFDHHLSHALSQARYFSSPNATQSFFKSLDEKFYRNIETRKQEELALLKKFGAIVRTLDDDLQNNTESEPAEFIAWLKERTQKEEESGSGSIEAFLEEAESWLEARIARESNIFADLHREGGAAAAAPSAAAAAAAARHCLAAAQCALLRREAPHLPAAAAAGGGGGGARALARALELAAVGGARARLEVSMQLYDQKGNGMLSEEEATAAVNAIFASNKDAIKRLLAMVEGIDKQQKKMMKRQKKMFPKELEAYWLDRLQAPLKLRCAFAWAEGRALEEGPPPRPLVPGERYRAALEEFFPEYKSITSKIMNDFEHQGAFSLSCHISLMPTIILALHGDSVLFTADELQSPPPGGIKVGEWHEKRKRRKRVLLNAALFGTAIGLLDYIVMGL